MPWQDDVRTTGRALKHWLIAQAYDALAVGALWFVGLHFVLGVPLAWLWALLAVGFQFIPWLGPMLSLIGPAITAALVDWWMLLWVLTLYAVVSVVDGFVFQPYFLKRTARVPIWASILTPIVMGLLFNIWGIVLAPPLLAIVYAFKARRGFAARGSRPPATNAGPEGPPGA
jgi:predicted PurR-regulated permease PerM